MHLTVNEIVYLLQTWNSWYLISHDEYLNSDYSDNQLTVTIEPFNNAKIPEEVEEDLRDYTDDIDLSDPDRFKITFLFSAKDHQPDLIFKSLKPILERAAKSRIEILNVMNFVESDLPDESMISEQMDVSVREAIDKFKGEAANNTESGNNNETGDREVENPDPEKSKQGGTGEIEQLHNEILITGIVEQEYIDVENIIHNEKELEPIELFLEAARLYETVDRNFKEPDDREETNPYECADESEAALVGLFLGTTTDYRPQRIDGKTIYSGAYPDELASIISYIRYKKKFNLFFNPYLERLRLKKKIKKAMAHKIYRQACSCIMLAIMVILFLLLWWIFSSKD